MTKIGITTATALLLGTTIVWADNHGPSRETLAAYAAMSKLEANKAEAAGAVMLAAIPDLPAEVREEAEADFASDVAQIDSYIAVLREMELDPEHATSIERFATAWATASSAGADLIEAAEDTAEYRQSVFAWWEGLDELDDLIDNTLEELLEANGVALVDD